MEPTGKKSGNSLINDILNWENVYHNAHSLLSVSNSPSQQEIESAYRQLARKVHPDKNNNSAEAKNAFLLLGEAKDYLLYLQKNYAQQLSEKQTMLGNTFYKAAMSNSNASNHTHSAGFGFFGFSNKPPAYSYDFSDYFNSPLFSKNLNKVSKLLLKDLNICLSPDGNDDFKIPKGTWAHILGLSKIYTVHFDTNMLPWLYLCQNEEDLTFFSRLFCQLKGAKWPDLETQSDELFFHEKGYLLKAGETIQLWLIKFLFINHATDKGKQAMGVTLIKAGQFELFKTLYEDGWFYNCDKNTFIKAMADNHLKPLSRYLKLLFPSDVVPALIDFKNRYILGSYFKQIYSNTHFTLWSAYQHPASDMVWWLYQNRFLTPETTLYTGIILHYYDLVEHVLNSQSDLSIDLSSALSLFVPGHAYSKTNHFFSKLHKTTLPERFVENEDIFSCQCELLDQLITRFRPADQSRLEAILKLVLNDFLRGGIPSDAHDDDTIQLRLSSDPLFNDNAVALYKVVNQHIVDEGVRASIWKMALYEWSSSPRMVDVLTTEGKNYLYNNPLGKLEFQYVFLNDDNNTKEATPAHQIRRQNLARLIEAEPRLLETQYASVRIKYSYMPYYDYTVVTGYNMNVLHLACYYGRENIASTMIKALNKDTQAHLINNMTDIIAVQTPVNNWLVHMMLYSGYMTSQKVSRYNAFHEAIMQGFDDIALTMIDKGADIQKKATIWHHETLLYWFHYLTKTEETPLELALKNHLPKTAKRLLIEELKSYIKDRQKQNDYLTRIGYGSHTFWGFGYGKEDKIKAANQLLRLIEKNADVEELTQLKKQHPALTQGKSGTYFNQAIFIQSNWQIKNGQSINTQTSVLEVENFQENYGIYNKRVP